MRPPWTCRRKPLAPGAERAHDAAARVAAPRRLRAGHAVRLGCPSGAALLTWACCWASWRRWWWARGPPCSASASAFSRAGCGIRSAWSFGGLVMIYGTLATSLLALADRVAGRLRHRLFLTELSPAGCRAAGHRHRTARGNSLDRLRHVGPPRFGPVMATTCSRRLHAMFGVCRCSARWFPARRSASASSPPASCWRS